MSRLSISSSTSNHSNYSSMSSLDSQSVDCLPPPPPPAQVVPPPPSPNPSNTYEAMMPPPPPLDAIFRERTRQKSWTIDSGFYSSTSSSLDRSPSASLAQVPYDDNDSGHYEAVPYDGNADLNSERFYENPQFMNMSIRPQRSNSESVSVRSHGVHFPKRSISYESENSMADRTDVSLQHLKRLGLHDNRTALRGLDLMKTTELSAQIAANAAEVAAHFQKKDESHEKWRPPVAKKNYFSPPTSPGRSANFDKLWKQMENPRKGVDNEFLDENYKVAGEVNEPQNSLLSQIQRRRSSMKYVERQRR